MRYFVLIAFLFIIGSLASALFFLIKNTGSSRRTVMALTCRVGFSFLLFVLILVAYALGWIDYTGIR